MSELELMAWAYYALSQVRPSFRDLPRDRADKLAAALLDDFTAAHGPPADRETMLPYTRIWVRGRVLWSLVLPPRVA